METITHELPVQTRAASFAPDTLNEKARTIDVTWSTGAAVKRFDWDTFDIINEELSLEPSAVRMGRLSSGDAPFLNCHSTRRLDDILGVIERAWLDGRGSATIRFDDDSQDPNPIVEPIWRKVVRRTIRNVSVGYVVHQYRDITQKESKMRTLLAIDWEPMEISAVPLGADPGAAFRSAEPLQKYPCIVLAERKIEEVPPGIVLPNYAALRASFQFRAL